MDAASSRRKQSRPARIEDDEDDVSESSPPTTPRSHHENGGAADDDRSESSPVEIRAAGAVMGPIRVRRLASPLDTTEGAIATLLDASGNALFFEVAADEQLLTTVRPTASIDDANCVVMEEAPDQLRLMMTKSVPVTETLIALYITATRDEGNGDPDSNGKHRQRTASDAGDERRQGEAKKYLCEQCNLVSFNSIDNLRAHQTTYCVKKEGETTRNGTPAPSMPRPPSAFPVPVSLASLFVPTPGGGMRYQIPPGAQQLMPGLPLMLNPPAAMGNVPVMPAALPHTAPNVIYLPIGYHDIPASPSGTVVMMLGQPQTIVPIAVQRPITHGAPLLPHIASSLAVHPSMCGSIPIPASLQLIAGDVITTIPVMAASSPPTPDRAAFTPHAQPQRPPAQQNAPRTPKRRQRCSTPTAAAAATATATVAAAAPAASAALAAAAAAARTSPVLDLTAPKRRRTHTENDSSPIAVVEASKPSSSSSACSSKGSPHRLTPQTSAAELPIDNSPAGTPDSPAPQLTAPKPFPCACGVGFSTEATLLAHVTTYCKLTPRKADESDGKEQKKPPPKCTQCNYQPSSASQLAVHIRNHHAEAFICNLCGYRGFSVRGIRSHLRTHPELDSVRFDDLLGLHVTRSAYVKGRVLSEGLADVSPSAPEAARTLVDA